MISATILGQNDMDGRGILAEMPAPRARGGARGWAFMTGAREPGRCADNRRSALSLLRECQTCCSIR